MSRVPRVVVDDQKPKTIVEHLSRVQRVVDGDLEFGSPQDPRDPASVTLADGASHNGTLVNIRGSWVERKIVASELGTKILLTHNLGVPVNAVSAVSQPNVRWLVFGYSHKGTGTGAGSTISCNYDTDDAADITTDAFPLRFYAAARTVGAAPDDLRVTLFFIPVVR
jgi:hypothetical protein